MSLTTDILIVTVTKVESKAIIDAFQNATGNAPSPVSIADRIYHNLGIIGGANVFMTQSEMGAGGLGASMLTVQKGIAALSPTAVIMVGIAFGINSEKQSIGDVLVSQRLMLYDVQRVGTEEGHPRLIPRGDRPHASPWLLNRLQSADLYWDDTKSKVSFGLILSGDKLVDNIDFRQQLHEFEPEAIGGEMEGAGLYVACQDAKVDWILVKAICDWADGRKAQDKEQRQQLAAHNAANFVLHALQQAPLVQQGKQKEISTSIVLDSRFDPAEVIVLLNKDLQGFTPDEQASFVLNLSRIVKVSPNQIRILRIVQGSIVVTLEMPEEAAKTLLWLFLQQSPVLQALQITKVELKQQSVESKQTVTSSLPTPEKGSHAESPLPDLITILFLAADPTDASRLRSGEEAREILEKLQLARQRERFNLHQRMSVRPTDISQALLDVQPQIVHFSGHGMATGELCFEDRDGQTQPIRPDALAALFEQFSNQVHCVVLNACYSEDQASAIAEHINYVVGMNQAIGDRATIAFAIGFYQALGAGRTIENAYKLGCAQIRLQGISEHLIPILITKQQAKLKEQKPLQETSAALLAYDKPAVSRLVQHFKTEFLTIPLFPGVGNSYLRDNYLDPPLGDVVLEGVRFRLEPKSLIFDTNAQIRYYLPRPDGSKEIELQLREPVAHVKSAFFLINSGNSKSIYASEKIGEIVLLFRGAPPLITELILGANIREWCLGNPGDWVRETSDSASKVIWRGMSKGGANAVIDCLEIPVYESMRNCALEKIIFVHKPTHAPSDELGVHFFVSAISLEIEAL